MRINILVDGVGLVRARCRDDWATGTTVYAVTAPRVSGTFTVALSFPPDVVPEVDTPFVRVGYGQGGPVINEFDLQDRPVINGVPLVGGAVINTGTIRQRRLSRRDVVVPRALGRYSSMSAPERTQDRAAGVVEALLTHWLTRPDNLALRLAAVRHGAERLGSDLGRQIFRQRERVAEAAAELERLQQRSARAAELAAMPPASADESTGRPPNP